MPSIKPSISLLAYEENMMRNYVRHWLVYGYYQACRRTYITNCKCLGTASANVLTQQAGCL